VKTLTQTEFDIDHRRLQIALVDLLGDLPERERQVVTLYFGLFGTKRHTYEEIGEKIGFSHQHARNICRDGLKKLRHPSRLRYLKPFLTLSA
jgi:RNA polymerase primary sigma factor